MFLLFTIFPQCLQYIHTYIQVSNYSLAKKEARLGGIMEIVGRESGEAHENPLPKSKSASNTKLKSDGTTEIPESLGLGQGLGLELTEEEELARTHSQIFMLTHSVWGSALFWGLNGIISFVALGNKYVCVSYFILSYLIFRSYLCLYLVDTKTNNSSNL